jgi:hypothetical protein
VLSLCKEGEKNAMRLRDYSHQVDAGDHAVQFNPLLSITWYEEGKGGGGAIPSVGPQMTTLQFTSTTWHFLTNMGNLDFMRNFYLKMVSC